MINVAEEGSYDCYRKHRINTHFYQEHLIFLLGTTFATIVLKLS